MKKTIIFGLVAAMFLASCSREETVADPSVRTADSDSPVTFTAGGCFEASVSTKAAAVTSLSQFNCIATKGASEDLSWGPTVFTKGSGESYTNDQCFWPTTDLSYHFYASNADLTYAATGCTVSPANAGTDVVVAYIKTPNYKSSNKLTFGHIFSRVGTVNLTKDKTEATVTVNTVTLKSAVTSGTYNLNTDDPTATGWTVKGTGADVNLLNSTNDVYVVPGEYTLEVNFDYVLGDYTTNLTKTADVTLVEGKINSISGTLSGNNDDIVTFTVEVTEWGTNAINITL